MAPLVGGAEQLPRRRGEGIGPDEARPALQRGDAVPAVGGVQRPVRAQHGRGHAGGDRVDTAAEQVDREQLVAQGQREQLIGLEVETDQAVDARQSSGAGLDRDEVGEAIHLPRAAALAHPDGGGRGGGRAGVGG